MVLEQGSVAESIRSFPRGKLVFDQPFSQTSAASLWLQECTKEELLSQWTRAVRRKKLVIRERHRVIGVDAPSSTAGAFTVTALDKAGAHVTVQAARVLLALGRRGTPRKLATSIPDAALASVHYSLADARSHAGAEVVVVGLGDVAMEAAVALARQEETTVTIVYRGEGFSRGKARNIDKVKRMVASGRITLLLNSTVTRVDAGALTVSGSGPDLEIAHDALFVMIGSLPPWPFLESAGVRRVGN